MSRPTRVFFDGPLISFAEGFARELIEQGYRPHAATYQLRLIAHLSRWLAARHLEAGDLSPVVLNKFLAARRASGYTLWLSPQALMPFLAHLRNSGWVLAKPAAERSATEELLASYHTYLLGARGLAESSAAEYVHLVRPFVATRVVVGELDWSGLMPADLTKFVRSDCRRRSIASAKLLVSAVRSLLVYLHVEGLIRRPLAASVPSAAGSKLAGLPRGLTAHEVEGLLVACNQRTPAGRRDFAILKLLVRLGLRAGEVRRVGLDDVDWRAGELIVRGKGNRIDRLPLPPDVGRAIATYLQHGRPSTAAGRTIFVRIRAPHRTLTGPAITHVVRAAASRAGLARVTPHCLRHTVATQMIRSGVPLRDIGQVLRHRRLITTAIYAKLDREGLRDVARLWPAGAA
ncbi:MAG: tyrosine-type recombinase/integrase [Terriglobales bacterium]